MTRNHQEIDKFLDDMISQAERKLDIMFARRLKELLFQLREMYRKYSTGKDLTFTDLNKYNRLQKETALIATALTEDYQEILNDIQELMETQYVENYLRSAYIYEFAAQQTMGFGMPSLEQIQNAIENKIPQLTLPSILEFNRNELVRRIASDISQGLLAGESYSDIAYRIEQSVGFGAAKARRVARTEGHRAQMQGRMDSASVAAKHAELKKMWDGTLDSRTRKAHQKLDGTVIEVDEKFVSSAGGKGVAPGLMFNAADDIHCRCSAVFLVNGELPQVRRARDVEDHIYQKRLADRIEKYMLEGMTHKQAEKRAKKEIKPPSLVIPYQTYEEWKKGLINNE